MDKRAKLVVPRVRPRINVRALHELFTSLNRPIATTVRDLFLSGKHRELLELEVDPRVYQSPEEFRLDYIAVNLLSKANFLTLDLDPEEEARKKSLACEVSCAETNRRFRNLGANYIGWPASILEGARWKISQVLGTFDPCEWFDHGRWGPGSSTLVKRDTSSEEKFRAARGITPPLLELVGGLIEVAYPNWLSSNDKLEIQRGNKVTFVPKNAKTHRPIAVEPDLNIWFQLSLGTMIRKRLKERAGIDLNTQRNNQSAARIGSITGLLATLDLKSASDTISKEVVRYLISDDTWHHVLDASRSRHGQLDGADFTWEKFSSMGNGFTFELETLIFWALASSTCEWLELDPSVWVYGDDVILPTGAVAKYQEVLSFCGFSLNASKSFWTGKFRESCGAHYFEGLDCQPIYWRSDLLELQDVYKAHNAIRKLADRCSTTDFADPRFASTCRLLVFSVPRCFRIGVPKDLGDVGFLSACTIGSSDTYVEVNLTPFFEWGWEGFYTRTWSPRPIRATETHRGILVSRLHTLSRSRQSCLLGTDSSEEKGNSYPLRDRTTYGFHMSWVTRWRGPLEWAPI